MRSTFFWLLSFGGLAAVSLLCGILVWPQLSAAWPSIEGKIDQFRRQPPLAKLVLLLFVGAFVVFGGRKTNGVDQASGTNGIVRLFGLFDCSIEKVMPVVTPEDIARGWQLWEVRTNSNVCYTMPEGATMASNWWVRGAFEDCSIVRLGDCSIGGYVSQSNNLNNPNNQTMSFPFSTNEYSSLWAFTWGKLRFELGNTNTEIVAVGAPMSAVPYRSRLWSAADTNDSRLVTWENFALNRDTNTPVNAQVELRTTGDFTTRSNEVETVYRRVDPEDWDGDGWRNDDDYNPYSWDDCNDDFYQELPEGADPNAYCWIEVWPEWNTWIDFQGDDWSNLSDPYFTARAGRTYRVWLLIGKTYSVFASMPVSVVGRSDERIEITDVTENSFTAVWPVTFTVAEGRAPTGRPRLGATWNDGGKSFYVMPNPSWLRGAVTWTDNYCCDVWGDGTNFTYACDNTCTCEGCTVYGSYWYEGYGLPVWGIPCGCRYVESQGDASVEISFDRSVALFEGTYTNAPGEVVTPISSNVVLTCRAYGGTYGGRLSVGIETGGRVRKVSGDSLPVEVSLAAGEERTYEVVYCPVLESERTGDVVASAGVIENFTGETHGGIAGLTAVRAEIECIVGAPENGCANRHKFGVGEHITCRLHPEVSSINWVSRCGSWEGVGEFVCPLTSTNDPIAAVCGDISYTPSIVVIEPKGIETRNPRCVTYGVQPGRAGWVGLRQEYYVLPLDVSFSGISIEEVPCTRGSRSGYFAEFGFDVIGCHSWAMGAGRWLSVGLDNKAGLSDTASITMELMRVNAAGEFTEDTNCCWTAGWVTWDIPFGWGPTNNVGNTEVIPPVGQFCPNVQQRFEINTDGDVTVRKFGNSAERLITGQLKLNGELWSSH